MSTAAAATKEQLLAEIKKISDELGVLHVSEAAIQPILSEDDRELCVALARAALLIAQRDNLKTLMPKHGVAAFALYNLIADEMALTAPKITKKGMRERAVDSGVLTKISPAAIEAIYNKDDQHLAHVQWSVAIQLASGGAMKETKTLQPLHADLAKEIVNVLKVAIDVEFLATDDEKTDENDEKAGDADEEAVME